MRELSGRVRRHVFTGMSSLSDLVTFVHGQHPELPERQPPNGRSILPVWELPRDPAVDFPDWLGNSQPRNNDGLGAERMLGDEPRKVEESFLRPDLLVPDLLAYYLPFHFYGPKTWGIYMLESGVVRLATSLSPAAAWPELLEAVFLALLVHEQFHASAEAGATRMESLVGREVHRHAASDVRARLREEAMANAQAARSIRKAFPHVSPALERLMVQWPEGYRDFARFLGQADQSRGFEEVAEEYRRYAGMRSLGGPGGFLFKPLSASDRAYIPTYWVLDGHRHGHFLPDWFLRRHPGTGMLTRW